MSTENFCFEDAYDILEVIERGAFNVVRRCVHHATGKQYAVRMVDKTRLATSAVLTEEGLNREADICHLLKHHHIVQLLETYSSGGFFFMVFEYLQGGDLLNEVVERASAGFNYSETVVSHYMKQILSAVRYCHDHDVVHCDIGPESVMLATKDCSAPVKLGCFGNAIRLNDLQPLNQKRIRQKHFTAPEIIRGFIYGRSADIWSCGVLLYTLLRGSLPFIGSGARLEELICRTKYEMSDPIWDGITRSAKDFLSLMLVNDAVDRHSAGQLLEHPWLKQRVSCAADEYLRSTVGQLRHLNAQRRTKSFRSRLAEYSNLDILLPENVMAAVNSTRWNDTRDFRLGGTISEERAEKLRREDTAKIDAVSVILDSLDDLDCLKDSSYESIMMDNLLTDQRLISTLQLYDKIQQQKLLPPTDLPDEDTALIAQEIVDWIEDGSTELTAEMEELHAILSRPHLRSLLQAHDVVAYEIFRENAAEADAYPQSAFLDLSMPTNANSHSRLYNITRIRLVQFQKNTDEPMGITLKVDDEGRCLVARIIHGGMIHKQATLHVGDEILEISGVSVANQTIDSLQRLLRDARGNVTFKIVPTYRSVPPLSGQSNVYLKCMFNYEPMEDELIPCTQAGIPFRIGQILLVINKDDPNWWQVRKFSPDGPSGLVPSPQLQEWRLTQLALENSKNRSHHESMNCSIFRKKKRDKEKHLSKRALADEMDMTCYEEVMKVPGFQRNTLVLLGAHGVGRRHIKNTLIEGNPDKYAYPIPHTTRAQRRGEEKGHHYFFVDQDEMLRDIATNQYLEYGSHEGAMYGTKLETIKSIINSGKIAILDVEPQALKMLRCAEFTPFVVFIAAPPIEAVPDLDGSLERLNRESTQLAQSFGRWFDLTIINSDIEETIHRLREIIDRLPVEEQWVPVNWVYR
ncbi:peripheral plasma membrane protein CASK [Galendromus occidentalis]|uniref:Peripheral plasma membrane protein CASK n=1 Tax=Galendromus occidentalis TaxID=34638 RepID=A0AAJ7L5N8_9ACAR|nr:peripheral plasma membrane protein CASK [Galendromus occidentalis]